MLTPLTAARLAPFWNRFLHHVTANRANNGASRLGREDIPRIGLAISGGPDSMSLAYLVSQYVKDWYGLASLRQLYATIIDHDARPGSRQEAERVGHWIEDMGIEARVEKMKWEDLDPLKLTNFESEARNRRYHQLAVNAASDNVQYIFTGHHEDDMLETLLLRLARGIRPSLFGIRGMHEIAPVPVSSHIHGIRNGQLSTPLQILLGQAPIQVTADHAPSDVMWERRSVQAIHTANGWVQGFPHGGITICRPLLPFNKKELLATCEANKIPFVLDKSNHDPTLTRRNAVRLMRAKPLPCALQPLSLLRLAQKASQAFAKVEHDRREYMRHISIAAFDFRSGTVTVHIPDGFTEFAELHPIAASSVLQQLTALVSPQSSEAVRTVGPPNTLQQFCSLAKSPYSRKNGGTVAFNHESVTIQRLPPRSGISCIAWRLSRAPMTSMSRQLLDLPFSPSDHSVSDVTSNDRYAADWSSWQLWDCRYWIRVRIGHSQLLPHIRVRAYAESDKAVFKSKMRDQSFQEFSNIVHAMAPGKIRFTLPVVTFNGEAVALPTLGPNIINQQAYVEQLQKLDINMVPPLEWEVAYKLLPKDIADWAPNPSSFRRKGAPRYSRRTGEP